MRVLFRTNEARKADIMRRDGRACVRVCVRARCGAICPVVMGGEWGGYMVYVYVCGWCSVRSHWTQECMRTADVVVLFIQYMQYVYARDDVLVVVFCSSGRRRARASFCLVRAVGPFIMYTCVMWCVCVPGHALGGWLTWSKYAPGRKTKKHICSTAHSFDSGAAS